MDEDTLPTALPTPPPLPVAAKLPPPPQRAPSFYHSSVLYLVWSGFIAVDSIDRLLSAISTQSSIPKPVPLTASLVQGVLSLSGILQSISALLFSLHHPRFSALYRLFHAPTSLYIVASHLATSITSSIAVPHIAGILASIATAATRTSVLLAPLEFSARADWPSPPGCAQASLSCFAAFTAGLCMGGCAFAIMSTEGGGLLGVPGVAGRLPLLAFIAGIALAFWGAAGIIVAYSTDRCMARVHIASSVPLLVLCIGACVVTQPAVALVGGSKRLDAGFAGAGPAAVAVLLTGTVGLSMYFLSRQANEPVISSKDESKDDDHDVITLNYYS